MKIRIDYQRICKKIGLNKSSLSATRISKTWSRMFKELEELRARKEEEINQEADQIIERYRR